MASFVEKGGYTDIERRLVNTVGARHQMKPSQASLDALHAVQETAWIINEDVMALIDFMATSPSEQEPVVRHTALEWASMDKADRRKIVAERADRRSSESKGRAVKSRIEIAQSLRGQGEFYQPQFLDFRGRLYPMNTEFNNQADHYAKGMMQFKNGSRLGATGLRNLAIHVANTYGEDKLSLDDREQWSVDRMPRLEAIASDYAVAEESIRDAAEPIAFYAAVVDYVRAVQSGDPEKYISRIPVAVDGTCNGLQILSLLGHDAVGAQKTNCTSDPMRQDIYMEVAKIAIDLVNSDLNSSEKIDTLDASDEPLSIATSEVAQSWAHYLKDANKARKAVKRAIMTTAYGVSDHTIGENLKDDGIVDGLEMPESVEGMVISRARSVMSNYFKAIIIEARKGAIQSAVTIMDYLTDVASALGKANLPMTWTTPDGLQVTQSYREKQVTRYQSAELGRLQQMKLTDTVDARKCGSGAAPQVVHSLDAAMLRMVAVRLVDAGVTDLCMIHDSYGVPAGDIDTLAVILREVAVDIFGGDWLKDSFHKEQATHDVELPEVPTQGDLDVSSEIPRATYFFS